MKIGSFFMILLAALVALGYLLSDSLHLREDVAVQQEEIERLTQAVQQAEQDKQNAMTALQTAGQNLQICQQKVDQSNQTIVRLTEENASLKEQVQVLATQQDSDASSTPPASQAQMVQATAIGTAAFFILGLGSMAVVGLKGFQKRHKRSPKSGSYVFLMDAEIKEVIKRRRETTKTDISV